MPAIDTLDNSLVLVTGASGFIGSHVIDLLLARGARVRGAVRSHEKGKQLQELFKISGDRLEYVLVEDIEKEGAFDKAVEGVTGIIHIASPLVHKEREGNVQEEWINPAVRGTTGILKSAQKFATAVKRVVITSATGAIIDPTYGNHFTYTEEHWNNFAVTRVKEDGENVEAVHGYIASKVLAERAAWDFTQKSQLGFDLVAILPSVVVGPIINPNVGLMDYGNSAFFDFLVGKEDATPEAAQNGPAYPTVDVRDVAFAHVESLLKPAAGGKRIAANEHYHHWEEYLSVVRNDAHLLAIFPNMVRESAPLNPNAVTSEVDASLSKELLGLSYRPFEQTIIDAARSYVEFARVKGWSL